MIIRKSCLEKVKGKSITRDQSLNIMKIIAVIVLSLVALSSAQPDGAAFRNLLAFPPSSIGHGGNIRPAFSGAGSNWEALKGAGVGIVLLQLEPNASHLPHWHRGTELLFVINGNLTVGITSFNATVGTVEYNLTTGDAIIVENAAAHYVRNRGPGRSINLSAFNSDNPGTQVSSTTLFAFPDAVVQTALQVNSSGISQLRDAYRVTPALYDGLSKAEQTQSPLGNFSQALGSVTVPLTQTATTTATVAAG